MKFQRTDLITRVHAEIVRRTQAADQANAKARQKAQKDREAYVAGTGQAWGIFAGNITAALDAGRPVTSDDAPTVLKNGWTDRVDLRRPDAYDRPTERVADTEALTTLLDLLESATDDQISTSSLERMGFRMGQLFRSRS